VTFVVSSINLKGGVGKTTASVALGETLACEFGKKVLLIDLDPQTNATIMLIGEDRWIDLNKQDLTLARLFKDAVEPGARKFDLDATLQRGVSNVSGATTLDLLPASLDLIDVQDILAVAEVHGFTGFHHPVDWFFGPWQSWLSLATRPRCSKATRELPIALLEAGTRGRLAAYDVVIIDCPPNLGCIPLNGLYLSDAYFIPTVPDHLSTYGIPQIVARVRRLSERIGRSVAPLGIVITKFQSNSSVHNAVRARLEKLSDPPVFAEVIRQSNQIAAAAEFVKEQRTLRQKYGSEPAAALIDLAQEFLNRARIFDGSL
jgi:chromosome partitioning protein